MGSYASLFLAALVAATIFPAQSEALLTYHLLEGARPTFLLIAVATVGNVLDSVINWLLGRASSVSAPPLVSSLGYTAQKCRAMVSPLWALVPTGKLGSDNRRSAYCGCGSAARTSSDVSSSGYHRQRGTIYHSGSFSPQLVARQEVIANGCYVYHTTGSWTPALMGIEGLVQAVDASRKKVQESTGEQTQLTRYL